MFKSKFGCFSGSLQDLSDGVEEPEGTAGNILELNLFQSRNDLETNSDNLKYLFLYF